MGSGWTENRRRSEIAKDNREGQQLLPKKKWSKPELVVYGSLEDLTRTVGDVGAMDGSHIPFVNKTR